STERILVSHAGTLPRPPEIVDLMNQGPGGAAELARVLPAAVADIVRKQVEAGVDVVNDGEIGKRGTFSSYVQGRMKGIQPRQFKKGEGPPPRNVNGRDLREFPGFFGAGLGGFGRARGGAFGGASATAASAGERTLMYCVEPLAYIGRAGAEEDIANLKAAVRGLDVEAWLPAVTPGTIEHWLWNDHYESDEAFLFAIADVMHHEYKAITDAGLVLQLDDPDLPDGWQMYPDMSVADYRKYAELRVEALNHAARGLPEDRIRFHTCWGSSHGPHKNDIPLRHIVDIILKVKAECISIEASNPRHAHDWAVWEDVRLPEGKSLMPGVIGHTTDLIEDPELVAERLVRYAKIVGRENVIAGTDCGLGQRVGHPEIVWAKLRASAEGARIATKQLWGRS
ncbi:MAG: cobalamin-independent methionine synthase II family protein, partial [Chloroflexota bacterium]|nr:cobalamin-independent methionine synthase II family protein [Chloroflexota bacterium]